MLSQIRQKKKKEAVRRLSQGPASSTHSQEPGQWSQTRKLSDQNKMQRRPGPLANRPVKRRHISPLDKGAYQGSATNSDQATQDSKNPRGAVRSSNKDAFSHFTSSTTNSTSTALTSSGSASGFSLPASNLQQSTGATSSTTSGVFGTVFGTGVTKSDPNLGVASSSSSTNIFTRPVSGFQGFSSGNATSPIVSPAFGSSFATNSGSVDSTSTEAGATVKFGDNNLPISSSSFVSFGGFGKAPSLSSGTVFPNASTNAATIQNTGASATTSVTFGMHEGFSSFADINKGSDSTPVSKPLFPITVQDPTNLHGTSGMGTLQSNSSFGTKPPFEVTSQPFSNFSTARTEKSHTGTAGELGRAFAAATAESRSKEGVDQAKITQEKTRGLGTASLTSLILRDIPESYNKNAWLKRFYSRFGEVTKVICSPSKKSATVTFKTHEAADAAKRKGKVLRPGLPPVAIFWKQGSRRSTSESDQQHDHQSADNENSAAQKRRSSPEKSKKIGLAFEQASKRNKTTEVLRDVQEYLHSLQPSQQAGEKLQVLEGVDKKLRQAFKRPSDISKAEAVVGTCKDMCPEKERYMREYQRRLSIFETIPGTGSIDENPQVNHARAVKEYDRSAADKEEPLPNELRPVPVLAMTMDYLATNIMDAGEGREGEWFDFLWNRTRGIRKDITQQHLCDPECVDLVEKTARFHIFCAHFLCEADMNSFDAKINTENLTKCHQTLKQFYVDLFKDKEITCPMEAEFRAYDILLNLNEGDILREVMTFRDEVQKSPEVRFSMSVFHAVNSNNFVRFFRLLRDASYLNACLLHRYFTQVRSKAVQTLNHSLSISNRTTAFPLKDLVNILAFENESEAGEFCTFHGLTVSEGCVNFSRSSFIEPETRFPVKRAWGLIESKRGVSVGEVVYNGPLPPPPQHQPGLSFSEDGRYVGDVEDLLSLMAKKSSPPSQAQEVEDNRAMLAPREAETQGSSSAVTTDIPHGQVSTTHVLPPAAAAHVSRQSVLPQAPPKATIVYSGEEIMIFTKKLFIEVMNEMFADVTKEALDKVHCCLQLSKEITDQVCEQTISEVITETAKSALEDEFNKKRIAEEKAASRERVSLVVQSDVTKDFVSRECARIVQEVVREVEEEMLEIAREKASKRICLSLLEEEVNSELREMASQVVNEEKAERDAKLEELALRVRRLRAARYFNTWLKAYRASVHLKVLLSTFPPGAPMLTVEEQLQLLVGHKSHDMRTALIRNDIERNEVHNALEKRQDEVDRLRRQACKPLDIPTLLADTIRPQPVAGKLVPGSPVYWKLVISLPEGCGDVSSSTYATGELETSLVIKEKFKRGLYPLRTDIPQALKDKVDLLSLYRAEVRTYPSQTKLFGICVKACYGVLTNTEQREAMDTRQFLGASAAMFVVDERELQFNSQTARDAHVRLRRVLESKPPVPTLPVAVVLVDGGSDTLSEDTVFSFLGIQRLRNDGLISDCKLWRVSSPVHSDDISRTLNSAVTWLGRHSPRSSVPKVDHLVNFIEDGLQREFAVPVAEDLALRRKAKLEQQCPEAIVELFNSVLEQLGTVASSASLQRLSWPISEFCDDDKHDQGLPDASWNSHHSLHTLHSCIASLTLPPPPPAAVDGTWESESALCLEYALNFSPDATGLVNRVKWILDRTKRCLEDVNFLSVSPRLSASQVPWPLILDACVNFQLTSLHSDPGVAEQEVYYLSEEKERFVQPTLWRRSVSLSKKEAAEASTKCRLETLKPNKTKHTKLHESFMEVERGLDELNVSLPGVTIDSPLTNTSSHVTLSAVTQTPVTECSSSSLGSMITATNERLKTALEEAKDESTRFEELLKNVLSDRDTPWEPGQSTWRKRKAQSLGESKKSPKYLEGSDAPSVDTSFSSLEERLSSLNETIKSQRRSDQFTERRLKQLLET